jgi:sugar/nucleoside kinase (ribokinase family)
MFLHAFSVISEEPHLSYFDLSRMPINPHQVFKDLKKDNVFTEEQADRLADALADMDVASATKEDLDELEGRIDTLLDRAAEEREAIEERLNQRIELSEERLEQKVEQVRSSLARTVVASVGAGSAFLAVVIPLAMYLIG